MPVQLTYPGVYVEEVPSGVRAITGVATSITAFVGRAARGPVDEAVVITSFGDFQRRYGGLWKASALGFSVRDFYLNGGSIAVVVRLFQGDVTVNAAKIARNTITIAAAEPGRWGDELRIRVDTDTRPFDANLGETATSLFNLYVRDGSMGVIEEHRNVTTAIAGHPRYLLNVLRNESNLIRLTTPAAGVEATRPDAHALANTVPPGKTVWDQDTTSSPVTSGNRGGDGGAITANEFTGGTRQADKKGLFALEKADLFNLLVIPPLATGDVAPAVSYTHLTLPTTPYV